MEELAKNLVNDCDNDHVLYDDIKNIITSYVCQLYKSEHSEKMKKVIFDKLNSRGMERREQRYHRHYWIIPPLCDNAFKICGVCGNYLAKLLRPDGGNICLRVFCDGYHFELLQ